ncbi:hypothetical protein [Nocardioides litoris]|uniref:hypothetical protein n=1 Tax=Nocardioides litoris TaxID=1926648 RepID=UPI00111DB72C|nr:hypothetical protein [Nocardioides litoris]
MDAEGLAGTFVVEVGVRQSWPFVGFCDARPTPVVESRLYLDAPWSVDGTEHRATDDAAWLAVAGGLGGLTVTAATTDPDGSLVLRLDDVVLRVSGTADDATTGPPWWLSRAGG